MVSDAGGSIITLQQWDLCLVLPIELTTFTAKETDRAVQMTWTTASEQTTNVSASSDQAPITRLRKSPKSLVP